MKVVNKALAKEYFPPVPELNEDKSRLFAYLTSKIAAFHNLLNKFSAKIHVLKHGVSVTSNNISGENNLCAFANLEEHNGSSSSSLSQPSSAAAALEEEEPVFNQLNMMDLNRLLERLNVLLLDWERLNTPAAADANNEFTFDAIIERLYRYAFLVHGPSVCYLFNFLINQCFLIRNRDTLRLILRGDWKHLPRINKTRLISTLLKTANNLTKPSVTYQLCQQVIQLVHNPWENTTLTKIVNGEEISDEEGNFFNKTPLRPNKNSRIGCLVVCPSDFSLPGVNF
jgi:hypothetical protein